MCICIQEGNMMFHQDLLPSYPLTPFLSFNYLHIEQVGPSGGMGNSVYSLQTGCVHTNIICTSVVH